MRIVLGPAGTLLNLFKVAVGDPIGLRLYASAREIGFAFADRLLHARDLGRYVRYGSGSISRKKDLDATTPVGNFRKMMPLDRHFIVLANLRRPSSLIIFSHPSLPDSPSM